MKTRLAWIAAAMLVAIAAAVAPHLMSGSARYRDELVTIAPAIGMPGAPPTSPDGLQRRIAETEARLREQPHDAGAAVLLADALLRRARATADSRGAGRARDVLKAVLQEQPAQYDALRMLGAIDLSLHHFRDALDEARRARDLRPDEAWNYGVMGDALLELGEYDEAFQAFDTMAVKRPGAGAYARVAYARELQGNLAGALQAMQLAAKATPSADVEAQAWYASQLGELNLKLRRLDEARREFRRAAFVFADYPHAMLGQGKVKVAEGDADGALSIYLEQLQRTPTLDLATRVGDLYARRGDTTRAEHYYQLAEDLAGPQAAQTEANLALFLADHNRKLPDAVRMAESIARQRHDIFTDDALAWAYYKVGRMEDAYAASARALRTGIKDERMLWRAAQIQRAAGKRSLN